MFGFWETPTATEKADEIIKIESPEGNSQSSIQLQISSLTKAHEEELANIKAEFKSVHNVLQATIESQKALISKQETEIGKLKNALLKSDAEKEQLESASSSANNLNGKCDQRDQTIAKLKSIVDDYTYLFKQKKKENEADGKTLDMVESLSKLHCEKIAKLEREHKNKIDSMRKQFSKQQNALKESVKLGIVKLVAGLNERQKDAIEQLKHQQQKLKQIEGKSSKKNIQTAEKNDGIELETEFRAMRERLLPAVDNVQEFDRKKYVPKFKKIYKENV